MIYSSERFTRNIILKFSQKFLKRETIKKEIEVGSLTSSDSFARERYFWLGSTIFITSAVILSLFSVLALILTVVLYHHLGMWYFIIYAPACVFWAIGLCLDNYERRSKVGEITVFTNRNLVESISIGLFIALFLAIQFQV